MCLSTMMVFPKYISPWSQVFIVHRREDEETPPRCSPRRLRQPDPLHPRAELHRPPVPRHHRVQRRHRPRHPEPRLPPGHTESWAC